MMAKRQVYLDHNATTPLHPEVKKTLHEAMEVFGNPSSMHAFGRQARKRIDDSRETVAAFINANPDELIFAGSGSEANNTVFNLMTCPSCHHCMTDCAARAQVITTRIEHPCVLEASRCVKERGIVVKYLDVDRYGKVKVTQLKELLKEPTVLVSVMLANNEIGTIQDIKEIARITHEKGAYFHTDAVQAVGKITVDVVDSDVDFLSFSAHKMYGPKGVGGLYIKKGIPFCPFIRGGHQERGRRAGTENTLGIIGMAKAVQMRVQEMEEEAVRLGALKDRLKREIEDKIPQVRFNGHSRDCLTSTLNVSFAGAEGEAILLYLDLEGIAVSTGSACASGSLDPSHVLLATGIPVEHAHGSIRISMGRDTTAHDIEYFLDVVPSVIKKIRDMSTAYTKGASDG